MKSNCRLSVLAPWAYVSSSGGKCHLSTLPMELKEKWPKVLCRVCTWLWEAIQLFHLNHAWIKLTDLSQFDKNINYYAVWWLLLMISSSFFQCQTISFDLWLLNFQSNEMRSIFHNLIEDSYMWQCYYQTSTMHHAYNEKCKTSFFVNVIEFNILHTFKYTGTPLQRRIWGPSHGTVI